VATSFGSSQSFLLTSESVTEGHPDKVCDQVSDAVLDGMLSQDAHARVACETAITKGLCVVIGEVTTHADLDIQRTIRDTIRGIGYNLEEIGFDADHALIQVYLKEQSPDIAASVDQQSLCDIISPYFAPAGICPGHHIKPGTRQPPSNAVPFSPRKGVVPASG